MNKQSNFLQDDDPELKEYYCPECLRGSTNKLVKMMQNLDVKTQEYAEEDLIHKSSVHVALHILSDANCPPELLNPIYRWFERLRGQFSQEQEDSLMLLKWKRSTGVNQLT